MRSLDRWSARHLARRAGFGEDAATLERWIDEGVESALHDLFDRGEGSEAQAAARAGALLARTGNIDPVRGAWLLRMTTTATAGREKLALVLHDHFATSNDKVADPLAMWRQYELLREAGPGPFDELLRSLARDPAMLLWLDSNANRAGHCNENFSRELMELFTLGLGSYTERDVQEAGRAFSGWHVKDGAFWFNDRAHDAGAKEVLGRRGALDGDDVIERCVEQPACARFIARKLLLAYLSDDPSETWVARMAGWLREADLHLQPALRRMFLSDEFYAPAFRSARVVSPVEWSVGLLRSVGARVRPGVMAAQVADMGQNVFSPPSVKGWPGGRHWVSTTRLLARDRFAHDLAFGDGDLGARVQWPNTLESGRDLLEELERWLSPTPLREDARAALRTVIDAATPDGSRVAIGAHALWTLPDALLG